ncbi:MAG: YceI family protein [Caldilineaceae bacterium]
MHRTFNRVFGLVLLTVLLAACAGSPSAAPTAAVEATATTAAPAPAAADSKSAPDSQPLSGQHTYVIVPAESKATYRTSEEFFAGALAKYGIKAGMGDVVGTTQEIEGQLQLNLDDLSAALGENSFTVKMNTLATDRSIRDNWIRDNGPNFNKYPLATFKANSISDAPTSYTPGSEVSFKLSGDLTIREVTKPATFDVKAKIDGNTLTGTASTNIKMSDFGIDPPSFANTLTVNDEVGIEVQITAREK